MAYYKWDKLTKNAKSIRKVFVDNLKSSNKCYVTKFQKFKTDSFASLRNEIEIIIYNYIKDLEYIEKQTFESLKKEQDELFQQIRSEDKNKKKTKKTKK